MDKKPQFGPMATETAYTQEGTPLLPPQRRPLTHAKTAVTADGLGESTTYGSIADSISMPTLHKSSKAFSTAHNDKIIFYDHNLLLTWTTFTLMGKSVFVQGPVLKTFIFCTTLSLCLAIGVYFIPSASKIDTQRFQTLCKYLSVFISFMLGIYVQQGFKHWWWSVTTFEKFLSSIRQLIFMLHQIKLDMKYVKEVEELCLASTHILNFDIKNASLIMKASASHFSREENKEEDIGKEVAELKKRDDELVVWLGKHRFLTKPEVECLTSINSAAAVMSRTRAVWGFIGEMLAHVTELTQKTLPPPVETRLIGLCQECLGEIEDLKMNITMQTPFMYAHLLSFLVHVNNFILAASCGISIGSAVNETVLRGSQIYGTAVPENSASDSAQASEAFEFLRRNPTTDSPSQAAMYGNFYTAIQTTWIQIIMVCLTPILHVAFLHIAHLLCYPFGDEDYHLPIETLIARLQSELNQMKMYRRTFRETLQAKKSRRDHECTTIVEERAEKDKDDGVINEDGEED